MGTGVGAREQLLGAVIESLADAMVVFDGDARVVTANPAMVELSGLDLADSIGISLLELPRTPFTEMNATAIEVLHEFVLHVLATGEPLHDDDNTRLDTAGRAIRVSRQMTPVRNGGRVVGVLLAMRDVTSANSSLFREAGVGMARLDWKHCILEVNAAFERLVGRVQDDLYGTPFLSIVEDEDRSQVARCLATLRGDATCFDVEQRFSHPSGTPVWSSVSVAVMSAGREKGRRASVAVVQDISERKRLEAINTDLRESERNLLHSLAWEASHDALTGLVNRRGFLESLERALAGRRPVGLLFIDLDGFKAINDTLGHDVGDAVLVEVGRRIRACTRAAEIVGRLGGDEFTVILQTVGEQSTAAICARIELSLLAPVVVDGLVVQVGASIGVAVHEGGPTCAAGALLKAADQDMYRAKEMSLRRQLTS